MVEKGRDDMVFTDMRGGVLRNSNYRARVFEPAVDECQKTDESFPSITPHDLRHTAASLAVSAGANVKAAQRMLGHAKASMTLDVYADLFDEDLDSVADNLDAAIRSAADQLRTGSQRRCAEAVKPLVRGVELRGFEPLTYSMRTSRATNCAIAPDTGSRLPVAASPP
jgi:hypothetical protein